jgi:hypothetical protein
VSASGHGTYRVVEVSPVAEDTLTEALEARTAEGWSFESIHFVMREGSHRPTLAFLFFSRAGPRSRPPRRRS